MDGWIDGRKFPGHFGRWWSVLNLLFSASFLRVELEFLCQGPNSIVKKGLMGNWVILRVTSHSLASASEPVVVSEMLFRSGCWRTTVRLAETLLAVQVHVISFCKILNQMSNVNKPSIRTRCFFRETDKSSWGRRATTAVPKVWDRRKVNSEAPNLEFIAAAIWPQRYLRDVDFSQEKQTTCFSHVCVLFLASNYRNYSDRSFSLSQELWAGTQSGSVGSLSHQSHSEVHVQVPVRSCEPREEVTASAGWYPSSAQRQGRTPSSHKGRASLLCAVYCES